MSHGTTRRCSSAPSSISSIKYQMGVAKVLCHSDTAAFSDLLRQKERKNESPLFPGDGSNIRPTRISIEYVDDCGQSNNLYFKNPNRSDNSRSRSNSRNDLNINDLYTMNYIHDENSVPLIIIHQPEETLDRFLLHSQKKITKTKKNVEIVDNTSRQNNNENEGKKKKRKKIFVFSAAIKIIIWISY